MSLNLFLLLIECFLFFIVIPCAEETKGKKLFGNPKGVIELLPKVVSMLGLLSLIIKQYRVVETMAGRLKIEKLQHLSRCQVNQMYKLIRSLLFLFDAEVIHEFSTN